MDNKYNYYDNVKSDIIESINEFESFERIKELLKDDDQDRAKQYIIDNMVYGFDCITGNMSGTYFCNKYEAKMCVLANIDNLANLCDDFGYDRGQLGTMIIDNEYETLDVLLRCYYAEQIISRCDVELFNNKLVLIEKPLDLG